MLGKMWMFSLVGGEWVLFLVISIGLLFDIVQVLKIFTMVVKTFQRLRDLRRLNEKILILVD